MATSEVAISIDQKVLAEVDELVARKVFPNRSQAIQAAVEEKISRLRRDRLARECAKLDRVEEQRMAEEGLREAVTSVKEI